MSSIRERWARYIKERTGMVETNEGQQRVETHGSMSEKWERHLQEQEMAQQIADVERRQVEAYKAGLRADPAESPDAEIREGRIAAAQRNFLMEHCARLIQRLTGEQMARGILGMEQAVAFSNAEAGAVNAQLERIKGEQANA